MATLFDLQSCALTADVQSTSGSGLVLFVSIVQGCTFSWAWFIWLFLGCNFKKVQWLYQEAKQKAKDKLQDIVRAINREPPLQRPGGTGAAEDEHEAVAGAASSYRPPAVPLEANHEPAVAAASSATIDTDAAAEPPARV